MTYMLYYYAASYVILHCKRKIFCVHGLLKEIRHTKIKLSAQAKLTKSAWFSTSFACILQHEGHNCFSFFHRIRLYSLQCISSLTNEKKWDKLLDSTSQLYVCFLHYTVYTTRLPVFWKNYNLWTPDHILLRSLI